MHSTVEQRNFLRGVAQLMEIGSFVVDVCEWLLVHWSFISCDHRAERMPTM
ncbi:Uncharacterised protein [Mycobacteroides abscessus subsp. abscessus]|nr:Uncharacterised protein [Mycobacteroides abscessus subsp. abscessus]